MRMTSEIVDEACSKLRALYASLKRRNMNSSASEVLNALDTLALVITAEPIACLDRIGFMLGKLDKAKAMMSRQGMQNTIQEVIDALKLEQRRASPIRFGPTNFATAEHHIIHWMMSPEEQAQQLHDKESRAEYHRMAADLQKQKDKVTELEKELSDHMGGLYEKRNIFERLLKTSHEKVTDLEQQLRDQRAISEGWITHAQTMDVEKESLVVKLKDSQHMVLGLTEKLGALQRENSALRKQITSMSLPMYVIPPLGDLIPEGFRYSGTATGRWKAEDTGFEQHWTKDVHWPMFLDYEVYTGYPPCSFMYGKDCVYTPEPKPNKSLELREGSYYHSRSAGVLGPLERTSSIYWPWFISGTGAYNSHGRVCGDYAHRCDLISNTYKRRKGSETELEKDYPMHTLTAAMFSYKKAARNRTFANGRKDHISSLRYNTIMQTIKRRWPSVQQ